MAFFQTNPPISISTFRNEFFGGGGAVSLETIKDTVFGNPTSLRSMQSYIGTRFWRYRIITDDGSRGWVQMTYPTNSGQVFGSYLSPWFWTGNGYNYASIYAQGIYPYNFQYWYFEGGGVFSYGSAPNIGHNDTAVLNLRAYFA